MTLWRRLVRYLAREDLLVAELAKQELAKFAYTAAQQAELLEKMAYAQGELAGQQKMADCIAQAVAARMGGGDDMVQPEDVANAKKALLH